MSTPCGTIEITESVESGNVTITACQLSTTNVAPGEPVVSSITVENTNNTDVNATIQLYANGNPVDSAGELIPANGQTTVEFTVTFDATGDFEITSTVTVGSLPYAPAAPNA